MRTPKEVAEAVAGAVNHVNQYYTTTLSIHGNYGSYDINGVKPLTFSARFINGEKVTSEMVAGEIVKASEEFGVTTNHIKTVGGWKY